PSAIADLEAQALGTDSNGDGTRQVRVTFTAPPGAAAVEVYRAGFGNYPEYDDGPNAGSVPAAPSYPPDVRWSLTGITASGQIDEVSQRDEYYYVAFAKNVCGGASGVSNRAGGVLNYVLGDVHDGQAGHECHGNNVVYTEDMSYLGAHYGAILGPNDPLGCLDVGPTVTGATNARPSTDDHIDFEDLIVFALNFSATPLASMSGPGVGLAAAKPPATMTAASADALTLEGAPSSVAAGDEFVVNVRMS